MMAERSELTLTCPARPKGAGRMVTAGLALEGAVPEVLGVVGVDLSLGDDESRGGFLEAGAGDLDAGIDGAEGGDDADVRGGGAEVALRDDGHRYGERAEEHEEHHGQHGDDASA